MRWQAPGAMIPWAQVLSVGLLAIASAPAIVEASVNGVVLRGGRPGDACSSNEACNDGLCLGGFCCIQPEGFEGCRRCNSRTVGVNVHGFFAIPGYCERCDPGMYVDGASCSRKKSAGSACYNDKLDYECNGECRGGRCCATRVPSTCAACNKVGSCDLRGAAGAACTSDMKCIDGKCLGGACCMAKVKTSRCIKCVANTSAENKIGYYAAAGTCHSCAEGFYSSGAGECWPKKEPGARCDNARDNFECVGMCKAGRCCNADVARDCPACNDIGECDYRGAAGAACATGVDCIEGTCLGGFCCRAAMADSKCTRCVDEKVGSTEGGYHAYAGSCSSCVSGYYVSRDGTMCIKEKMAGESCLNGDFECAGLCREGDKGYIDCSGKCRAGRCCKKSITFACSACGPFGECLSGEGPVGEEFIEFESIGTHSFSLSPALITIPLFWAAYV